MNTTVLKAFNSATRRFAVGDPVETSDDLSPHDFDDLKTRKFIGAAKSAAAPVKTADTPAEPAK